MSFSELLAERREGRAAAGSFTCYDVTTAIGVVRAAEAQSVPAILLVAEGSFRAASGRLLVSALLGVADEAGVPMCVELDHVTDDGLIDSALAAGIGAVMADGSRLPLEENVAFAAAVKRRSENAGVEVELGRVEGGEDVAVATEAGAMTDPEEAAQFASETGCDCLAVSIGNVHGRYASAPLLDWARLERIGELVEVPLSLHGASGLPAEDLRRAVSLGISKVNVNTEIRERYVARLAEALPEAQDGLKLLDLNESLVEAVAAVAREKLELLTA